MNKMMRVLLPIVAVLIVSGCNSSSESSSGGGDTSTVIANAGADQQVHETDLVTLNGSQSSSDSTESLLYAWEMIVAPAGSGAALSGASSVNPTFIPDVNGTYIFHLTVSDGTTTSAADEVVVTAYSAAFITTWKTDNVDANSSGSDQLFISTGGETGSYTINWGDGAITRVTGDATHTYATAGTYVVTISGDFPRIYFMSDYEGVYDNDKLLSVDNWGKIPWRTMERAFWACENLVVVAEDKPDLSGITSMNGMFYWASSFNSPIGDWNVSTVSDMSFMLAGTDFNQSLAAWDTSNVTDMSGMFRSASNFNQPIGDWNTSNVTDMTLMFDFAEAFNQPIGSWDTSKVISMYSMFSYAKSFNQPVGDWNTSNVTKMSNMFQGAVNFDQPLALWDTSKVVVMDNMFAGTPFNQPIGNWDTSSVLWMNHMFANATKFNQPIGGWDTSNVTTMQSMFNEATAFQQDISGWNIGQVTDMDKMFFASWMSTTNYDRLLWFWSEQAVQNSVKFDAGCSRYTAGSQSEAGRTYLINTKGWTITDCGSVTP